MNKIVKKISSKRIISNALFYTNHISLKAKYHSSFYLCAPHFKYLTIQSKFCFSSQSQKNVIIPQQGLLNIKNSQHMQLLLYINNQTQRILLKKQSLLQNLQNQLIQKLSANKIKVLCHEGYSISSLTPLEALINRFFFILIDQKYSFRIDGQLLRGTPSATSKTNYQNLQLPLITRSQLLSYASRLQTWLQSKYSVPLTNTQYKLPPKQVKKLLIQALVDPYSSTNSINNVQDRFRQAYWEVQEMLDKKEQAGRICAQMVRRRMAMASLAIIANIAFIWAGTYVYYSWDIIQPIAYFISSMAGIVLCSRFFKIKRPFSLVNYKQYMIKKHMPVALKQVGLDINELKTKQMTMIQLQSQIKDFYLKKL